MHPAVQTQRRFFRHRGLWIIGDGMLDPEPPMPRKPGSLPLAPHKTAERTRSGRRGSGAGQASAEAGNGASQMWAKLSGGGNHNSSTERWSATPSRPTAVAAFAKAVLRRCGDGLEEPRRVTTFCRQRPTGRRGFRPWRTSRVGAPYAPLPAGFQEALTGRMQASSDISPAA